MVNGQLPSALRQLRTLFAAGTATGLTDSELLERYATKRAFSAEAAVAAETAFEALVDRHGPMVWGICRRVLGDAHEAEDAFQATFLVLVRKAGSLRVDGSLGRWLYGVAHRVALRRGQRRVRRGTGIARSPMSSSEDPVGEMELRDLRRTVGEELDRLPVKYRCPVELCHLQGMTYDQAARHLNVPAATVKSRLVKGRLRLRQRLARRGVAPGAVGLITAISRKARAAFPRELFHSAVRAATSCAPGVLPAAVGDLAEGVLKMMMWEKIRLVMIGAFVAVGLTAEVLSQQPPKNRLLGLPQARTRAQPAEKPNAKPSADPRWLKSLPNGATVEVVGISSHPSGPDTWWRPDGTPLREPPCDPSNTKIRSDDNAVIRAIAVRVINIPFGADHGWWINEANGGSHAQARRDGKPVADMSEAVSPFPAGTQACTLRFKVAAGPWSTVQTWGTSPGAVGQVGSSFIFGDSIGTSKGTSLSVTHNIQNMSVRLVAIDGDGKEHPATVRSGGGVKDFHQIVVEFDLLPDEIKEYRVQSRPYEVIEIPDIALKPRP